VRSAVGLAGATLIRGSICDARAVLYLRCASDADVDAWTASINSRRLASCNVKALDDLTPAQSSCKLNFRDCRGRGRVWLAYPFTVAIVSKHLRVGSAASPTQGLRAEGRLGLPDRGRRRHHLTMGLRDHLKVASSPNKGANDAPPEGAAPENSEALDEEVGLRPMTSSLELAHVTYARRAAMSYCTSSPSYDRVRLVELSDGSPRAPVVTLV
jgi:hypothetical protein